MKALHVTEVLWLSGVVDYSFCDEESKWRGSEVSRAVDLANKGTLKIKSVPRNIEGYVDAFFKFKREKHFVCVASEESLEKNSLGPRGRMDARGFMDGSPAIVDWKTGQIRDAVALQLVLYGHMRDPSAWVDRCGVQLMPDGDYRIKTWPLLTWHSDLTTALACVRVARWKLEKGLVKA